MGIDIWQVIEAAKTKPFGFMPFYPGPGLGGHCIPIDPFYLTWKAREYGMHTRFIELAGEVNAAMPDHVITRVAEALNEHGKPVRGSKILLLGLAYKANVDDMRESPSLVLIERLEAKIAALAEGSVAKRDMGDLARRVDEVAEGMRRTDETMRQLQLPPELEELEEAPPMLREEA